MTRDSEIRSEALLRLFARRPDDISADRLAHLDKRSGGNITAMEFRRECHVLVGQGFAVQKIDQVTGEEKFLITSAGVLEYERRERSNG